MSNQGTTGDAQNLTVFGLPIKYVTLVILVVQNSAFVLTMRYSRIRPGTPYLTSTAVVVSELLKLIISTAIHLHHEYHKPAESAPLLPLLSDGVQVRPANGYSISWFIKEVFSTHSGFLKICAPAILYTFQNNLQFIAASNLDAVTFQVTYQGKILTTALLSVVLLRHRLSKTQWLSLLILTIGVAAVQASPSGGGSKTSSSHGSYVIGLGSIILACFLSGLVGVYFEMVLKRSSTSLWVRNIQLSTASVSIALLGSFIWDGPAIRAHGFFQGYDLVVFTTIFLQAGGGLIVAVVIKYADNILKGFATSLSAILSTAVSVFFFDFNISIYFLEGAALVFIAVYLYSIPDASKSSGKVSYERVETDTKSDLLGINVEKSEDSYTYNRGNRSFQPGVVLEKIRTVEEVWTQPIFLVEATAGQYDQCHHVRKGYDH
jgi:UDP-sugar transporter A1/2/3